MDLGFVAAGVAPLGQRRGVAHLGRLVVALHHRQLGGIQPVAAASVTRAGATDSSRSRTVVLVPDPADELPHHAEAAAGADRPRLRRQVAGDQAHAGWSCPRRSARPGPRRRRRRPGSETSSSSTLPSGRAWLRCAASTCPIKVSSSRLPAGMPDNSWMDPQDFNENSRLRASDADRDTAAAVVNNALAEGRLTPEEHSERLDAILRGEDACGPRSAPRGPAGAARRAARRSPARRRPTRCRRARRGGRIVAIFGGASRKGAWHPEPVIERA